MLDQTFIRENLARLKEVAAILTKYEMDEVVERLHLPRGLFPQRMGERLSRAEKIRRILEELGPTFIKLGQALSCHPDLLPADIIRELEKLQDKVAPFPFYQVQHAVSSAFKKPLHELFVQFDPVPLASASIAQVHQARLQTGERVIVKVQRPHLQEKIREDLNLMSFFALLLEKYVPEMRRFEPSVLVRRFEKSIMQETDFRQEANNLHRFRTNFSDVRSVYFPNVFREFSNERILTLEYIHGAKISTVLREKNGPHDRARIARNGVNAIYKQIFQDGFFHADPHQGNLIILPDDSVCFIDAGMAGTLNEENKTFLANVMIAIAGKNTDSLISLMVNSGLVPDSCDLARLKEDLEYLFVRFYDTSLEHIDLAAALNQFVGLLFSYRIRLPSDFTLLVRCLIILEGVGRELDPGFNPTASMIPFARELMRRQYHPVKLARDLGDFIQSNLWISKSLPNDLLLFLQKFIRGKTEIKLDHQGLEDLNGTINRASSRFTAGILTAGIIVASALVIRSNVPPVLGGYSVLGILGYLFAALLSLVILKTILEDIK